MNCTLILASYGQTASKMIDENGNDAGRFSHILRVFLIAPHKTTHNIYNTSFLHADTLISDIKTLRQEDKEKTALVNITRSAPPVLSTKALLGLPPLPIPKNHPEGSAQISSSINLGRKLFFDR